MLAVFAIECYVVCTILWIFHEFLNFKITSFVSSHETRRPLFITNILSYFLLFYNVKRVFVTFWIRFTFVKKSSPHLSHSTCYNAHIIHIKFLSWLMINQNKFDFSSSQDIVVVKGCSGKPETSQNCRNPCRNDHKITL